MEVIVKASDGAYQKEARSLMQRRNAKIDALQQQTIKKSAAQRGKP